MNNTDYFSSLKRIDTLSDAISDGEQYLLLPNNIGINYFPEDGSVLTSGLGKFDKRKDFIEIVGILDSLSCTYEPTRVFSSRPYIESLKPIPNHVTVQGIILSRPKGDYKKRINELKSKYLYSKTDYDNFWVSNKTVEELSNDDVLIILNRRVGGWDGSVDKPVIELLGAGGHVSSTWESGKFISHTPIHTIKKEINEELGLQASQYTANRLGGFYNEVTGELVILYGIWISIEDINQIQEAAFGNIKENVDGIYLGIFDDVIKKYLLDASPFAGGEATKSTNFPSNKDLMNKINNELKNFN